jgi:hypothetical protein
VARAFLRSYRHLPGHVLSGVGHLCLGEGEVPVIQTPRVAACICGSCNGGLTQFSGAYAPSLHVAGSGLMGDLAGETVAGCRLVWPDACRRWLPVWLPELTHGGGRRGAARSRPWEVIGTV